MKEKKDVIHDIKNLVNEKGFIYVLSMILTEDFVFDMENLHKVDMYSRVSNNEALLLLGFLIQKDIDFSFPDSPQDFIELKKRVYNLLEELHNSFMIPFIERLQKGAENGFQVNDYEQDKKDFFGDGNMLVEPIFYAGSGVYDFQYLDFLDKKYVNDKEWLEKEKSFKFNEVKNIIIKIKRILHKKLSRINFKTLKETSPELIQELQKKYPKENIQEEIDKILPMMEIHQYVDLFFDNQGEEYDINNMREEGWNSFYKGLIDLLVINKSDFKDILGIDNFLNNFSFSLEKGINSTFQNIGDFNILKAKPIIKLDDDRYFVPIIFILYEAIYESPYYWMIDDKKYINIAGKNRGDAGENITYDFLVNIFGKENTFKSVKIEEKKGKTKTDIDILCILGSKALCVQVKSQKLTELSRKGNDERLKIDFQHAVQDAYNQGLISRDSILNKGVKFIDNNGNEINLSEKINEVYIMGVTTENFPSLTHQSNLLLEKKKTDPYGIFLSIFDLELLTHYLNDPYDFLYYIRQRIDLMDYFKADEEMVYLGFHITKKLRKDDRYDSYGLDTDFGQLIDRNYYPIKAGFDVSDKGDDIKQVWKNDNFEKLFIELKQIKEESIVDIIFHLLDLSGEGRDNLINYIIQTKNKTLKDNINHNFSIPEGNITYVSFNSNNKDVLIKEIINISEKRKYIQKSNIWIGLGSLKDSKKIIDTVFYHKEKWEYDDNLEQIFRNTDNGKNPDYINLKTGVKYSRKGPCPCGSGKKFKRCCWDKYYL
ncbi:SEC-C domain-containing protein [Candidatus Gracilibacteria bacterium]|nr:SEC-C domain-containing protein [Candidatus Gracilibacteria bacterium]